jgi:uncharacterized protein YndB with AHSA1/START domain
MLIERSIEIERPADEVFDFLVDARNDVRWCHKVRSVELVSPDGPGAGARYRVVHKPVPLRPAREMDYSCEAAERPHRIAWREDDGTDVIEVEYRLTPDDGGTLFEQRDEAHLGAPRLLRPVLRAGLRHDLGRQLRALRRLLEAPEGVGRA